MALGLVVSGFVALGIAYSGVIILDLVVSGLVGLGIAYSGVLRFHYIRPCGLRFRCIIPVVSS